MALRLVLAGVVISLGLTLPSTEALERWSRSGPGGWYACLFEWENQRPADDDAFVFVADAVEIVRPEPTPATAPIPEASQPVVAETTQPAEPTPAPVVATEKVAPVVVDEVAPVVVTEEVAPVVVVDEAELNEIVAEWIAWNAPVVDEPTNDEARAWIDARVMEWMTLFQVDIVAEEPVAEQVVAAIPAEPTPSEPVPAEDPRAADREFAAVVEEMVAAFAQSEVQAEAKRQAETEAAFEEMVAAFAQSEAQAEAERLAADFKAEPIEGEGDLYADVALALLFDFEEPTPEEALAPESDARSERLAKAVELTRAAVQAWASLLHGPAVVTIPR